MSESIWKKEISFSRKPKPAAPVEPPPASVPAELSVPWWKKEITLSRKPQPVEAAPVAVEPPPASVPAEPSVPWWKKEISLSRKPQPAVASAPPAEVVPAPPPPLAEPVVPVEAVAEPAPVADPVPAAADGDEPWLTGPVLPPEPVAVPFSSEVVETAAPPPATPAPPAVPVPDPVPAGAVPEPALDPEPEPAVAAVEPQSQPVAAPEPEPLPDLPPASAAEPAPASEPQSAPALAVPEPQPEPEPVLVHPPVADTEPAPTASAATPFWKKEISLSRPSKRPKQRAPKTPRGKPSPRLGGSRRGGGVVGLTIGASQLAAARVSNDAVAELHQVARAPLAPGIVVGGELRDPAALAAALSDFFAANRLPRKGVRLGIATPRIGVRIFEVVGIDDERQLGNAVRFRAQEVLPVPLDEAVLDYRVLGERVADDGRVAKRVLLVVAHRELVDRYVAACRKAGIVLSGIDLEAFALLRALAPPVTRDGSALVALSIGHERTTLAVSDGRVCEFTRVLEWGGWALNVALARALGSSPSEVEPLKRQLSLAGGPAPESLTPEQGALAVEALRRAVDSLAQELISSLQFYQGQPGSLGIGEIAIAGGTAHMAGLAEELEQVLGVRVRVGNPLNRVRVSGQVAESDVGSLAVAIGLGIED